MRKTVLAASAASTVALTGVILALLVAGGALATGYGTTSTTSVPSTPPTTLGLRCQLAEHQPPEPLAMTTSHVNPVFPTITTVVEKEVALCTRTAGDQVRDLETFVRIETDRGYPTADTTRIQTTLCINDLGAGTVRCSATPIALGPPLTKPLAGCSYAAEQPQEPIAMDSIDTGTFGEKLIKVDKTVYSCGPDSVADVYTFTSRDTRPDEVTTFFGVVCFKSTTAGQPPSACNTFSIS